MGPIRLNYGSGGGHNRGPCLRVKSVIWHFSRAGRRISPAGRPGRSPERLAALSTLAAALLRVGRFGEALAHVDEATLLDPGRPGTPMNAALRDLTLQLQSPEGPPHACSAHARPEPRIRVSNSRPSRTSSRASTLLGTFDSKRPCLLASSIARQLAFHHTEDFDRRTNQRARTTIRVSARINGEGGNGQESGELAE